MICMEAVFGCAQGMSPDVAARLAALAERYGARLQLEYAGKRLPLDSLIGMLSVPCRRGEKLLVISEGDDEQAACQAMVDALRGE